MIDRRCVARGWHVLATGSITDTTWFGSADVGAGVFSHFCSKSMTNQRDDDNVREPRLLTTDQAAVYLSCGKRFIYRLVAEGRLRRVL